MPLTAKEIEALCLDKERGLIGKYFGKLIHEAAYERPETIGDYTPDLPLKVEKEYKAFLEEIWKENAPDDLRGTPHILEEQKLRDLIMQDDRELVAQAHQKAITQTLRERHAKAIHKDVSQYEFLLKEYTLELLTAMKYNFMEEITGDHISSKSFENK